MDADAAATRIETAVAVIRSVKQQLKISPLAQNSLSLLMEDFRLMVNDCIRIGLEREEQEGVVITSMRSLSLACYHQLATYDLLTYYRLTAISKATGILRNYRRAKKNENPATKRQFAYRPVLTDCYGFRIFGRLLRLPFRKREYTFIVLNDHVLVVQVKYLFTNHTEPADSYQHTWTQDY